MPRNDHNAIVQKSSFSLIELVVVIAILFVMMGFGIAAYQGVKGHKSSEAGAQRVADMIAQARQYAVSENARVALLLPDRSSGLYSITASPEHYNKLPLQNDYNHSPGIMMRFCTVDSSRSFKEWLPVGDWVFMPESSYFASEGLKTVSNIPYPNDGNKSSCPALIFQGNGTLNSKMTGEIYVDPFSTKANTYEPGKARQYVLTVNWLTGQTTTKMVDR